MIKVNISLMLYISETQLPWHVKVFIKTIGNKEFIIIKVLVSAMA